MLPHNQSSRNNSLFSTQIKAGQESSEQNIIINPKEGDKYLDKEKDENLSKLIKKLIFINLSEMKESSHKEFLQFQHRINDSIQTYAQNLKNVSTREKRLIEQFADFKIKIEKIEMLSEKLSKIDDRLTIYEIRLNNLIRDFKVAVDKYDSLFLDNMSIPGIIGKYCKYKNIKEFLSFAYNKFNEFDLKRESDAAKMRYNQEKIQKFMKKINCEMDILREESVQISTKKSGFLEKRMNEEINEINKKIELIPNNNIASDDIEKKISDLMDNYDEIKNFHDNIDERLNVIEDNIEMMNENKSPNRKNNTEKKEAKVTFSNLSELKFNNTQKNLKKEELSKDTKNNNYNPILSKKFQKYHSLNINNSNIFKYNNNINNKKEQIPNLDDINEENNDNDNTPINLIKPVNFSSTRFRDNNTNNSKPSRNSKSTKNVRGAGNNILKNFVSTSPNEDLNMMDDSSDDEEKKQKIEEIIVEDKKSGEKQEKNNLFQFQEMKMNNSFNDKNDLLISTNRKSKKILKDKNKLSTNSLQNENNIRNSHTFPKEKINLNRKKSHLSIKSKIKIENKISNEKIKKFLDKSNKSMKGGKSPKKKKENLKHDKNDKNNKKDKKEKIKNFNNILNKSIIKNNNLKTETNIINNKDLNIIKNNSENNINNTHKDINSPINSIFINNRNTKTNFNETNNNTKNNITEKDNSKANLPNIELFNNHSIKNYLNKYPDKNDKKTIVKNKSFDIPKLNNNFSTSISIGKYTDISFINNIHFSNNEINKKNKELPNKSGVYNLSKLEAMKKEEFLKNNKPTIFDPKEIPIITNSSLHTQSQSHSFSKKNIKREKIFHIFNNKYKFNGKKKENNINLELKIIPAGFKISKKIQVNLSDC